MIRITLILLVCFAASVNAQNRRFEFMFGIGNNNQVQRTLNNYFYQTEPLYLMDETKNTEISNFKYNVTAKININEKVALRLRYGHSKTQNSYYYTAPELYGNFDIEQIVTNLNPALCYGTWFGKFNISTGLEFAFYKVKDYHFNFEGTDYVTFQGQAYPRKVTSELIMEGGRVIGINNFLDLQYAFSSRLGLVFSASYGLMFTKFGDVITINEKYGATKYNTTETKEFKEKYFSAPEILISLNFKFGKLLTPIAAK